MAVQTGPTTVSEVVFPSVASGINLFDSFDNLIIGVWGVAPKN
jgi:hypothetical protein